MSLIAGDIRHHDLRISHPCPSSPKSCPPPLISYRPYRVELTALTMAKANPMYLIVGGSHPHAFLHDRRMIGRDMKAEWGSLAWTNDTPTQVVSPRGFANSSVSVDSPLMVNCRPRDVACISRHANSLKLARMNLWARGPLILCTCSTSTILLHLQKIPLSGQGLHLKQIQRNLTLAASGSAHHPNWRRKALNVKNRQIQTQVLWISEDNLRHFENLASLPKQQPPWLRCRL